MGLPGPLFHLFSSFQTLQILQQLNVKKCTSSIRCRDSNPRSVENESPPISTRPGFPPPAWALLYGPHCFVTCPPGLNCQRSHLQLIPESSRLSISLVLFKKIISFFSLSSDSHFSFLFWGWSHHFLFKVGSQILFECGLGQSCFRHQSRFQVRYSTHWQRL